MKLYDVDSNELLEGRDRETRITIIDDDKPGYIAFEKKDGSVKVSADEETAEIKLVRTNGSDGTVRVYYRTISLGEGSKYAQPGVDYEHVENAECVFLHGETEQTIKLTILACGHEDASNAEQHHEEGEEGPKKERDETFGIELVSIEPAGAKLSRKNLLRVNIVSDEEKKKKEEAFEQLIRKILNEDDKDWIDQFVDACKLQPQRDEDGELQEVEGYDAFVHFATIGWKVFYAFIPPAYYCGGWPCFVISLVFIGITTAIVENFATLFGCVLGIKPAVTAITFVALGTSLPDTFASMTAAAQDKYADAAISNVTGSNSVNVFLGLGLPWLIGAIYEAGNGRGYFVPSKTLGFSVVVFICCALVCIAILIFRRVMVGGELGGEKCGRVSSMIVLMFLWGIYIIMSILQAYGIGGIDKMSFGIADAKHPDPKCWD